MLWVGDGGWHNGVCGARFGCVRCKWAACLWLKKMDDAMVEVVMCGDGGVRGGTEEAEVGGSCGGIAGKMITRRSGFGGKAWRWSRQGSSAGRERG